MKGPQYTRAQLQERGLLDVLLAIAAKRYVLLDDVLSDQRSKTVTAVRHEICALLHSAPYSLSYPEIGRILGRDHTTIIMGQRKAEGVPLRANRPLARPRGARRTPVLVARPIVSAPIPPPPPPPEPSRPRLRVVGFEEGRGDRDDTCVRYVTCLHEWNAARNGVGQDRAARCPSDCAYRVARDRAAELDGLALVRDRNAMTA